MKRKLMLFIAAAAVSAAALAASALGETGSASRTEAPKGAVVALRQTALGKVLTDARGRTLYLFESDKRGRSACSGGCAAFWPPLTSTAKPRWGTGVRPSLLGLSKRADGKRQVTYAGHPLYTFTGDTKTGQTTGQGRTDYGAGWYVVAATGRAVKTTAPAAGGSGGGYGRYGSGR